MPPWRGRDECSQISAGSGSHWLTRRTHLRALITGIAGFAGSHLADCVLANSDYDLSGVSLPTDSTRNLANTLDRVDLHLADLSDYAATKRLLAVLRPDYVYHLAAQASVARSWADPWKTMAVNIAIQLNLFRAIIELELDSRVLVIGSADEYGAVTAEDLPIDETTPLRPLNPYAVSKVTQDFMGLQYHLSHGLYVVRVRPFNHIGPRQRPGFVVPDLAKQIAWIEAGLQAPIVKVGNLKARRDFADVRDIVLAYYLALEQGQAGEVYNLGSARSVPIEDMLQRMLAMSPVSISVEEDPELMRPADIPNLVCDASRFRQQTGWIPQIDLDTSLRDVLNYWREEAQRESQSAAR